MTISSQKIHLKEPWLPKNEKKILEASYLSKVIKILEAYLSKVIKILEAFLSKVIKIL